MTLAPPLSPRSHSVTSPTKMHPFLASYQSFLQRFFLHLFPYRRIFEISSLGPYLPSSQGLSRSSLAKFLIARAVLFFFPLRFLDCLLRCGRGRGPEICSHSLNQSKRFSLESRWRYLPPLPALRLLGPASPLRSSHHKRRPSVLPDPRVPLSSNLEVSCSAFLI